MLKVITFTACSVMSLISAQESNQDLALQELIDNGIDMYPQEYVKVSFSGTSLADFDYPTEEDNFYIASQSSGSSQMMVNGAYAFQQVLSLTLQAKDLNVGNNPSYLNVRAPGAFQIPITVIAEPE